jgi:hypothetical protein
MKKSVTNRRAPLKSLELAFKALKGQYQQRKAQAEKAVHEWRWATSSWFHIEPLWFERHGFAPGRKLRHEPLNSKYRVHCGLDRMGRVVVERGYHEFGFDETFYNWSCEPIEVAHFDYWIGYDRRIRGKGPINLLFVKMEGGRVISTDRASRLGTGEYKREEYQWDGSRLTEVRVYGAVRSRGRPSRLLLHHTERAHYNREGLVHRVENVWPPLKKSLKKFRPKESIEVMFERRGNKIYRNCR